MKVIEAEGLVTVLQAHPDDRVMPRLNVARAKPALSWKAYRRSVR